jgi:hypothetical protein
LELSGDGSLSRWGRAQQAYLCLGTVTIMMFHARNPTQTDSTSHVYRAPRVYLSGLPVQSPLDSRGPCVLTDLAGLCGKAPGMMKSLKSQSVCALLKGVACKSATAPQPGCYNVQIKLLLLEHTLSGCQCNVCYQLSATTLGSSSWSTLQ